MSPTAAAARYRDALPQLTDTPFLTDGGIETTLIFHDGYDLPHFAAYDLLDAGRRGRGARALLRAVCPHRRRRTASGIVLETATWRANADWAERLGHSPEQLAALNRRAVELLEELRDAYETENAPIVISRLHRAARRRVRRRRAR